ncbi:MAG: cupin domain-containing protein [Pyrinomonadaceae bacterium]
MSEPTIIACNDLEEAIQKYTELGYRLDMIFPADSPREALMSEPPALAGGLTTEPNQRKQIRLKLSQPQIQPPAKAGGSDWATGRAGIEYRDLIPGRLGGKAIASHIRLADEGPVADYVHYHKVDFQMIYCLKGRIKGVYEDQGPPFWLESGDCVVQPPEIRHRVLECAAGAEVLEVTMPAEHETWVEHEMSLPNDTVNPEREFNGQRFSLTKNPTKDLFIASLLTQFQK